MIARYADIAGYAVIVVGMALSVAQFVANRSLWHDEACLALNIVNRSFLDLTQPLDYAQGAPLGFLMPEKLAVQVLDEVVAPKAFAYLYDLGGD